MESNVEFEIKMFSDRSYSVRMSSAVAKVAKPVMRGMHVQVILQCDQVAWINSGAPAYPGIWGKLPGVFMFLPGFL